MEGYSKKAGGEEGEHRAAVKLAQAHRQKTTPALCGHIERERWRYSRQCAGGAHPNLKKQELHNRSRVCVCP